MSLGYQLRYDAPSAIAVIVAAGRQTGARVEPTAALIGVSRRTLYRWLERHRQLANAWHELVAERDTNRHAG